ncbi:unnamed protein product, partial [marine sediment metagenome]
IDIDIYQTVKRRFRLPSNKMEYVAQYLGLAGKVKHPGMPLWIGCMNGDPDSWDIMKKYNIQDVILLEGIYRIVLPWIPNHPNHALYEDVAMPVCTKCGSENLVKRGYAHTRVQSYQRFKCKDCGGWSAGRKTVITKEKRENILRGL